MRIEVFDAARRWGGSDNGGSDDGNPNARVDPSEWRRQGALGSDSGLAFGIESDRTIELLDG